MTRDPSDESEQDPASGTGGGAVESDAERDARLRALLTVKLAARDDERPPEPVAPRRTPAEPEAERGGRTATHIGAGTVLSVLVLVALFATGAGLVYAGTRIIRSSTQGEILSRVSDPAAPGYEALVEPTPTLVLIHDVDGLVEGLTVLTLTDPGAGGGGVMFVPTRVVAELPVFETAPIEAAYDLGSPELQADVVGDVVTAGIDEHTVVDADRWAGLVAPVAPLTIDNPDDLEVDGELRFPAGDLELEAEDVGPYLAARAEGESDLGRLFRHEVFWDAWLEAVAAAGTPDAVPGELESGIGRFVRELAAGPRVLATLPVRPATLRGYDDEPVFRPVTADVTELVARLVPFPRSPRPGVRERVRVLNGTGDLDAAQRLARSLPALGVEVAVVGNARSLAQDTTTIAYVGPDHEDAADAIRDLLGVGEVLVDPRPGDVADITVTLGADHD